MTATLRVLKFLHDTNCIGYSCPALNLMTTIFSEETIKKWSHARRHKSIIETMTYSFVGKLAKKGLIRANYNCNGDRYICTGYVITQKGVEHLKINDK